MMKFSIVIPVYNVEKYLKECLESVINQSYTDYEIICVEDASTDASYNILLDYSLKYEKIRLIRNLENRGLSYSRNVGLEIASGEYVWFVDSDDYIEPDALQSIADKLSDEAVDILNINYKEVADVSYSDEWKTREGVHLKALNDIQTGKQWFCENVKNHTMVVMAWSKVFKKSFLYENNLKFYEGLLHEDVLFFVQSMIPAQRVSNLEKTLYMYRQRGRSITKTITEKRLDSYVVIVSELLNIWKSNRLEESMDEAMEIYISEKCLPLIRKYMYYFPNHKSLEIGSAEDQFLYNMLSLIRDNSLYQRVHLDFGDIERIKSFSKRIIYGAGMVAREVVNILEGLSVNIDAIAVSNAANNAEQFGKYKIYQIDELIGMRDESVVIVAVTNKHQEAIKDRLSSLQFRNIVLINIEK